MRKFLGLLILTVIPALVHAQANPNQIALLRWYDANLANSFAVGDTPDAVAFDGANIWVANYNGGTVTKLRANDGPPSVPTRWGRAEPVNVNETAGC